MKTILDILVKAGGWHPGLYLKIENAPYMELVIEAMDESGPCGLPSLSIAHYGEQNGYLMRDPEMCFELGLAGGAHLNPFYWRNDYLLCGFSDLHRLSKNHIVYVVLARKVFGREYMKIVGDRVGRLLREWGYMRTGTAALVLRTIFEALLYKRSPHLDELKIEDLKEVIARRPPRTGSYCVVAVSRVLASMGAVPEAIEIKRPVKDKKLSPALTLGVPAEWCRLSRLGFDRSTYALRNRNKSYYFLLNVGRWLGKVHPDTTSPADWTRELAAEG